MKHTIYGLGGRRLIIKPDMLNVGMISVTIFDGNHALLGSVSLAPSGAVVAASALDNTESYCHAAYKTSPLPLNIDWGKVSDIARGVV